MSIREIITQCGGHAAIAERSHGTPKPIGIEAVKKWARNGVSVVHWPMLIEMSNTNPDALYKAHLEL